jgi:hypothetical protein
MTRRGRLNQEWTQAEMDALRAGARIIPGRTPEAVRTMRQPDPNRDLFQHLFSLVRTTNADLRREIASEAALLLLEENLPPEVAVTEAAAKVRRFYGRENWHTEISKVPFL